MAPNAKALSKQQIEDGLEGLPQWVVEEGQLCRTFKFKNFSEALGWMVRAGIEAEKLDHHPDWSNSYNKVQVRLKTHSIDALSELDLKLAGVMDKLAEK